MIYGGFGYFFADMMIEKLNFLSEHSLETIGVLSIIGLAYWFFVKRPKDKHCYTPMKEWKNERMKGWKDEMRGSVFEGVYSLIVF